MNLMKAGARIFLYILCIVSLVVSVIIRRIEVSKERAAEATSYIVEVEKYGKPVTVTTIKPSVFEMKEKFTVVPVSERKFEGFVTRKIASGLREGQVVTALHGCSRNTGRIVYISSEMDMMAGLYKVEIEFNEAILCEKGKLLVETRIGREEDVIEISNDVLYSDRGRFYLWKLIDDKAYKEEVILSARNGYSSIVKEGLKGDEIVVVTGQSQLVEGDRVRVINSKDNKYMEK
ncbi:MAG: hypothetical protein WCV56_08775 [Candidatus Omnitrophota bacterium]